MVSNSLVEIFINPYLINLLVNEDNNRDAGTDIKIILYCVS